MSDFTKLLKNEKLRGLISVTLQYDLLAAHKAAIAQAVKDERERIRVCLDRIDLQGLYDLFAMFGDDYYAKRADHEA